MICAIDDSVGSVRALRVAADLAERLELDHSFVHVDTDDPWADAPLDPPRGTLAALTVVRGEPVAALRELTADADASLLVVGSRGSTSWRAPLGSVSRALAADAPVPVMVVPPTAAGGRLPITRTNRREGRFSTGSEERLQATAARGVGSFADGHGASS